MNILGFVGQTGAVAAAGLCCCSMEAAINNAETDECGYIPRKRSSPEQATGHI